MGKRSFVLVLAFVCLCLKVDIVFCATNRLDVVRDSIYTYMIGSPCVRLLNSTGTIGCGYRTTQNHRGPLVYVENAEALNMVTSGSLRHSTAHVVVLSASMFAHRNTLPALVESGVVEGILVLHSDVVPPEYSPDNVSPLQDFSYEPSIPFQWNENGLGTIYNKYEFPIFALNATESLRIKSAALANEAKGFKYPLYAVDFFTDMYATTNSQTCLARGYCDPVGGLSTWSYLPRTAATSERGAPWILASAALDANAFFHDLAVGGAADTSGLVAVLAAATALAPLQEDFVRRVVFAAFEGESWGYLGSDKFFSDVDSFECAVPSSDGLSCSQPYAPTLAFRDLSLEGLQAAIDVRQVASSLARSFYVYTPETEDGADLEAVLEGVSLRAITEVPTYKTPVVEASSGIGLPPSSLHPLLRLKGNAATAVLADHNGMFANHYYNSMFDGPNNVESGTVCEAATLLARTLYAMAVAPSDPLAVDFNSIPTDLAADCALVSSLLHCLTEDLSCELVRSFIPNSPEGIMTKYTGVYRAGVPSIYGHFVHDFLGSLSVIEATATECASNADCEAPFDCLQGKCTKTTAFYHNAYSTGLSYDYTTFEWVVSSDPVRSLNAWTESRWSATYFRLYEMDSPLVGFFILVGGLVFAALCFAGGFVLSRSFEILLSL